MQITPAMLDTNALKVLPPHYESSNEKIIITYLNALLASGKACFGISSPKGNAHSRVNHPWADKDPDGGDFSVLIIRLEGET